VKISTVGLHKISLESSLSGGKESPIFSNRIILEFQVYEWGGVDITGFPCNSTAFLFRKAAVPLLNSCSGILAVA